MFTILTGLIGVLAFVKAEYPPTGPYPTSTYNSPLSSPTASGGAGIGQAGGGGVIGSGGAVIGGTGVGGFGGPTVGGPFPFGGIPPISPPPPFSLSTICTTLENIKIKAKQIAEPLFIGGVGAVVFWVLKSLFVPHFGIFASAFKKRIGGEEKAIEKISRDVARALTDGICTDRIACSLGKLARGSPIVRALHKVMGSKSEHRQTFFDIFKDVASGRENRCEMYTCFERNSL